MTGKLSSTPEERMWGEGPEGEIDVFRYINDHSTLLSMLYDLNMLPEQHPDPESKERWMIFNIVNHWRENDLRHDALRAELSEKAEHGFTPITQMTEDDRNKVVQAHAEEQGNLQPGQSYDKRERSPADFAIEFGDHLAKAAEGFLAAYNRVAAIDQDGDATDTDALLAAEESCSDHYSGLVNAIYEFRKRAKRANAEPSSTVAPLDAQWCMDAFWRVNPGRNASVPSLYLLDFAREVLRVYGAQPNDEGDFRPCVATCDDPALCEHAGECYKRTFRAEPSATLEPTAKLLRDLANTTRYPAPEWMDTLVLRAKSILG